MKYARLERERRYRLDSLPPDLDPESAWFDIEDRYIEGTRLRLRHRVEHPGGEVVYKFSQKFLQDPARPDVAQITTQYLNRDEYDLLATLPARVLAKRVHVYHHDGSRYIISVFAPPHEGLINAEIEFDDDETMLAHPHPPFAAQEITTIPRYCGGHLARASKPSGAIEYPAEFIAAARELMAEAARLCDRLASVGLFGGVESYWATRKAIARLKAAGGAAGGSG